MEYAGSVAKVTASKELLSIAWKYTSLFQNSIASGNAQ
jgi:hypothetical protein